MSLFAQHLLDHLLGCRCNDSSRGMNNMPTAYDLFPATRCLRRRSALLYSSCGICNRMPEPSPVSGSHPHAPRCVRLIKTSIPLRIISWLPLPANTRHKPHAARIVLIAGMVETLCRRDTMFRVETGRHGLRLKDSYPFAVILFGRALGGDQMSHISAGKAKIGKHFNSASKRASTMQNFDTTHANFGAGRHCNANVELTSNSAKSAIIPLQPQMDFDQLITFLEVARQGSFSRAGEKVFRSQSAVSAQIRQLEQEYGDTAARSVRQRRVKLTPSGPGLLTSTPSASATLRDESLTAVADHSGTPRGHAARRSANEATCLYVLPEVFAEYCRRYPPVQISIYRNFSYKIVEKAREWRWSTWAF